MRREMTREIARLNRSLRQWRVIALGFAAAYAARALRGWLAI